MPHDRRTPSVPGRFWCLLLIGLLALGATAIHFASRQHCSKPLLTDDQRGLIRSLTESASAANGRSSHIRVTIFHAGGHGGNATENLEAILEADSTCTWEPVGPADIQAGALGRFDVVIFPGGSGSKQAAALGDEGKQAVREFVRSGGGYVGICGGAFLATAKYDWSLGLVNAKTLTGERHIPGLGMRSMAVRGVGTVKMELTEAGKTVLGDFPGLLDVPYSSGPILSPAGRRDLSEYVALALFRTEIWEHDPQQGTMVGTPAIVAARFGEGRVIVFSPHPETTEALKSLVQRAVLATARKPVDVN